MAFTGHQVITSQTILAMMLPDRLFFRYHDIIYRTYFRTSSATITVFKDAETHVIELDEIIHFKIR